MRESVGLQPSSSDTLGGRNAAVVVTLVADKMTPNSTIFKNRSLMLLNFRFRNDGISLILRTNIILEDKMDKAFEREVRQQRLNPSKNHTLKRGNIYSPKAKGIISMEVPIKRLVWY